MSVSPLVPFAAPVLNAAIQAITKISERSPFADLFAAAGAKTETSGTTSTNGEIALPQDLARQLQDVAQQVRAKFESIGADTTRAVELHSDGLQLRVENDHPQRFELEQTFTEDAQLSRQFGQLVRQVTGLVGDGRDARDIVMVIDRTGARFKTR